MSVICYMSVICLVLGGVARVRLYAIYAHLCNHMLLRSGGGTWGTALYTVKRCGFWESGCRRLARKRLVHRGSGALSTSGGPGAWQHCGDSMFRHIVPRLIGPEAEASDRHDPAYPSGPH